MAADYGGDVSPDEAMALLEHDKTAVLVDVRSQPEWSFVGVPDLSDLGREPVFLEWQSYPAMALNPDFVPALTAELERRGTPRDAPILFLCRSGARSKSAARTMTEAGYNRCLNIAGGFEGGPDPSRHRGVLEGWKARALPWTQP
jgi:rhodanese-related sulfurtransferase